MQIKNTLDHLSVKIIRIFIELYRFYIYNINKRIFSYTIKIKHYH